MMREISLIYTTVSSKKEADKLSEEIINSRLSACVNIHPITSRYFWEGRMQKEKEYALLFKTPKKKEKKLIEEIKKIHPYKTPCIITFTAETEKKFFEWVINSTK